MKHTNLLSKLKNVRQTSENTWQAACPAHDDKTPSLTVTKADDKVLLHCHAGCSINDILSAIGMELKDLFLEEKEVSYLYLSEAGEPLFRVVRAPGKRFFQQRMNGNGEWLNGLGEIQPVVYNLPQILAAGRGETIFIVEGEKDADNLARLGLVTTTNPGGAGRWRDTFAAWFKGADVVIIPDNDPPGKQHGQKVAQSLQPVAESVKILDIPGLEEKGDVTDWIKGGGTKAQLLELAAQAQPYGNVEWPEPQKLEVELLPVAELPPAIIPEPFRPWLEDVAERMQCPIDFLAAAAMIVAGSVIGSGCGMRPKQRDSWEVIPNVWGGIIARPGMLKTPALTEIMGPLRRLEVDAKTEFEQVSGLAEAELAAHRAAVDAIKAEMSRIAKGRGKSGTSMEMLKAELAALEEPVPPVRRRYLTNDPTIEKMAELLNENSRGILYFRDELVGLLLNLDREDRQADRAFYLEAWNGFGSYITDRIGRGTIDTDNLCVSILGGIQPSRLLGYLHEARSDLGNDGLIQRFQLLVYPDEPTEWRLVDEWPDTGAKNRAFAIFEALSKADFQALGAEGGEDRPFFRFSLEAQEVFNGWLTNLQSRLRKNEEPIITEHLSKYRSLMPSLALIIHLVDVVGGQAKGPVSSEAARKAVAWCQYLESHARRIYGMGERASLSAAQALAQRILDGEVGDVFTGRDVYINNWSKLTNSKAVEKATDELIAAGWLRKEIKQTGGRPSTIFKVNPVVYTRG